jgi:hypothetical protein
MVPDTCGPTGLTDGVGAGLIVVWPTRSPGTIAKRIATRNIFATRIVLCIIVFNSRPVKGNDKADDTMINIVAEESLFDAFSIQLDVNGNPASKAYGLRQFR